MTFLSDKIILLILLKPIATCSGIMFWVLIASLLLPAVRKLFSTNILQAPPTGGYLDGLDALRGFAALFVLLTHSWYFAFPIFADAQLLIPPLAYIGNKAVPMFAMLCGYLIYRSLVQNEVTPSNLQKYLLRRFFRIYPLYAFSTLIFCFLSITYFIQENCNPISFIVSDLFMTRVLWAPSYGNPVAWSLFTEIFFYLLAPLLLLVPRKKILTTAIVAFLILTIADQGQCPREYCLWKYFFAGIIAYELPLKFHYMKVPVISYALVASGTFILGLDLCGPKFDFFHKLFGSPNHSFYMTTIHHLYTLGIALGFGLIMMGLPQAPKIATFLNRSPFRLMALISYSIFLLHPFYLILNFPELSAPRLGLDLPLHEIFKLQEPLPNWYFFGVFIPGFLPWAFASYLLIERPFLNIGKSIIKKRWAALTPIQVLKAA